MKELNPYGQCPILISQPSTAFEPMNTVFVQMFSLIKLKDQTRLHTILSINVYYHSIDASLPTAKTLLTKVK